MNDGGVCRTAPATPGLLKRGQGDRGAGGFLVIIDEISLEI